MFDSDSDFSDLGVVGTIELSESGQPSSWIHIFPTGSVKHPKGRLTFNEQFHQTIVKSVTERHRGIPAYVDTDHDNGISNAWVSDARYIPGHGTDIKVDWTPLGEERVNKKLYRFVSPEFGPYEDAKTGTKYPLVLNAASLTNRPYLKDLGDVSLTQLSELGVMAFADNKAKDASTATKADPDPDHDGDDDSTKAGDTDHDYTGPDGKRVPKKKQLSEVWSSDKSYSLTAEHISKAERDAIDPSDFAGPHDSYPIRNQHEATAAWDLAGHAADPDAVRARIRAIASHKGFSLPSTANSTKETKMSEENKTDAAVTPAAPTVDMLALSETVRQATAQLGEARTQMTALAEKNAALERKLSETELRSEMRLLSEASEMDITGDDGVVVRGMSKGFSPVALDEARALILDNFALREPLMNLLKRIQRDGLVPLTELGTAASGDEHDPFTPVALSADETQVTKLASARALAGKAGQDWTKLTADEKIGFIALTEKSPR